MYTNYRVNVNLKRISWDERSRNFIQCNSPVVHAEALFPTAQPPSKSRGGMLQLGHPIISMYKEQTRDAMKRTAVSKQEVNGEVRVRRW